MVPAPSSPHLQELSHPSARGAREPQPFEKRQHRLPRTVVANLCSGSKKASGSALCSGLTVRWLQHEATSQPASQHVPCRLALPLEMSMTS